MTETLDRIRLVLRDHRMVSCGTSRVRCACSHLWMSERGHREHLARAIEKVL